MSDTSKIEWTNATLNCLVGCKKISPGCANCYACKDVIRMAGNPNPKVAAANKGLVHRQQNGTLNWTGKVNIIPERLANVFEWPTPKKVFVNSLSDMFHEDVPEAFIRRALGVMRAAPWHTFQILTKRHERLAELGGTLDWPDNVWMGVSVENNDLARRADALRAIPAKVKFLSVEPMLSAVPDLDVAGLHWVITGGESGPRARPFDPAWAIEVRDKCEAAGVNFFHKQNGGRNKKLTGRLLDGREYNEMPLVREVPVPPKGERRELAARLVPEANSGDAGRVTLEVIS